MDDDLKLAAVLEAWADGCAEDTQSQIEARRYRNAAATITRLHAERNTARYAYTDIWNIALDWQERGKEAEAENERLVKERDEAYSEWEIAANPTHWMPLPAAPKEDT